MNQYDPFSEIKSLKSGVFLKIGRIFGQVRLHWFL